MDPLFDTEAQGLRFSERYSERPADHPILPHLSALRTAESTLPTSPEDPSYLAGRSQASVAEHITNDIVPALTSQTASSRYFGFVIGGVLPIAEWADNVVSRVDQNVQVHLPDQTVATAVESAALGMMVELVRLKEKDWQGRTFTTGATASNVLGLACGREAVLAKQGGGSGSSVGEVGLLAAALKAGVSEIQVLTSAAHSSLSKAASVVGLGRQSVKELRRSESEPWRLDLDAVERELQRTGVASIIAVSAGEVNTGRLALSGREEWERLRRMADEYGAWIHVDAAFGIFARALDQTDEFQKLHQQLDGIELADSITVDGHKLLNVPYDCGMFFTASPSILSSVFTNPNAAYLSSGASAIPSPLNIGLENSRRFRALPAYAVLLSEGRPGFAKLLANMARLTRGICAFLRDSEHYELLPTEDAGKGFENVFIVALFRARSKELNDVLVQKVNGTRQMYVSGTSWKGEKAVRVAVSNWRVDAVRDLEVVKALLTDVAEGRAFDVTKPHSQS